MKEVPNPFWLGDQFLLDHVFNPVSWWSEYNYGKDAMDLRLISYVVGHFLFLCYAVVDKNYMLVFFVMVLLSLSGRVHDIARRRWVQNNKTGKNVVRVIHFSYRMIYLSMVLYVAFPAKTRDFTDVRYYVILGGFFCIFFICEYLEATDALPPAYRERKTSEKFA